MGFIADQIASRKGAFPGTDQGRRLWQAVFSTNKEEGLKEPAQVRPSPTGGSYGRSLTSTDGSVKRLIQALRSMAPGGWSDDRYSETNSMFGIVYVAVERISRMLSQAEFQVFHRDAKSPDGKREVQPHDEPEGERFCKPYDLVKLLQKPNNQDSFGKWMWRVSQQLRLTGSALTWMLPNKLGVPMELYCIPTAIAIPQPAVNPDYPDGFWRIQPVYPYGPFSSYPTPASAVGAPIAAQWMMRFLYPHPLLRYDGYSPLTGMRLEIDALQMINRSRHYSMRKSINPSGVLNFDDMEGHQPLADEEIARIHTEWENNFQGPENHGRLIVGTPGGKLEPWGSSPKDMDYPNGFNQLLDFILGGGFGITKPAAGMVEDSSYATLYATLKQLHLITLDPDCNDIGSELTRHLAPFFGDDLIVEVRCKKIDDHDVKLAQLRELVLGRAITKGELRKQMNDLGLGAWGDERDNEIAGVEAPPQQMGGEGASQQGQGKPELGQGLGLQGIPGAGNEMANGVLSRQINPLEGYGEHSEQGMRPEPFATASTQPKAGRLARHSMGQRKGLSVHEKKSLYDLIEEACNGNGNGHS